MSNCVVGSGGSRLPRVIIAEHTSTHLPPIGNSKLVKPVILPPGCARLLTKPLLTGSITCTNTIGMVRVS